MKVYDLKQFVPPWHFAPATVRQLKVLRFFGIPIEPPPTKGVASGLIGRLFSDAVNKHLWAAYVYTTGDEESTSVELCPHDREGILKDARRSKGSEARAEAARSLPVEPT